MAILSHAHVDGSHSTADDTLWGVYIIGMDEWRASNGRLEAMTLAQSINQSIIYQQQDNHPFDPWMWAMPDLWPGDAADHEKHLIIETGTGNND